jgi:hypothetical protein
MGRCAGKTRSTTTSCRPGPRPPSASATCKACACITTSFVSTDVKSTTAPVSQSPTASAMGWWWVRAALPSKRTSSTTIATTSRRVDGPARSTRQPTTWCWAAPSTTASTYTAARIARTPQTSPAPGSSSTTTPSWSRTSRRCTCAASRSAAPGFTRTRPAPTRKGARSSRTFPQADST